MRISDWSSDVCSSDLGVLNFAVSAQQDREQLEQPFQAAIQRRSAQPPLRLAELLPRRSSRLPSQHLRLWLGLLPVLEQFQTPPSLPSFLTRFGWLRWQAPARFRHREPIGQASWRERECQYV